VLAETLAAGPCGDLTFIAGEYGNPLTKESFGNLFRKACRAADVPGSAHGVRKIAATRAANAGATVAQLEAIFGWQGGTMAALYTRAADRRRLSIEAMSKLENDKRTSIVAPCMRCDTRPRKINEISCKNYRWWAREDSNLQPSGYERRNCIGKISKNLHFCARSLTFVLGWLRRIIGYSLVECGREQRRDHPGGTKQTLSRDRFPLPVPRCFERLA
jgi:Phage integrase family